MLKMMKISQKTPHQQHGAAAVEFAIIAMLLFTLLFGIMEFGRLFYVFNSVQEVTRHTAREAVVRWWDEMDDAAEVENAVLFGGTSWPAGAEITAANISIDYLNAINPDVVIDPANYPGTPADNISACLGGLNNCIAFVRVSITGASYAPMIGLFPFLSVPIPASTVTMPAESMGYRG